MSMDADLKGTLERLEAVLASDASAVEHLKSLESLEQVVGAIAELGGRHGIAVDAAALQDAMARSLQSHRSHDVDDAELEGVAGGGTGAWVLLSLGGFGAGCILFSLSVHLAKLECGKMIDGLNF